MIEAALFDLDGTLIDSADELVSALNDTLRDLAVATVAKDVGRTYIGDGIQRFLKRGITKEMWDEPAAKLVEKGSKLLHQHYANCYLSRNSLYPRAKAVLTNLAAAGIKLGLVTNKPIRYTKPILAKFLPNLFSVIIGGDSIEGKCKPEPEPLLLAATQLGVQPSQCVMVGDSMVDAKAARAASYSKLIILKHGYHGQYGLEKLESDYYADSLIEVEEIIVSLAR